MTTNSINYILDFFINKLPSMVSQLCNWLFTPIKSLIGESVWDSFILVIRGANFNNPFGRWVINSVIVPIGEFGLIGLFSATTIVIVILLKLIDLIIPI